jgi:hypothetical protein
LQQKVTDFDSKLYKSVLTTNIFNKIVIQAAKFLTFCIANTKQCVIFATETFTNLSEAGVEATHIGVLSSLPRLKQKLKPL